MDRRAVEQWVNRYEQLWRTSGTDRLGDLFDHHASYRRSPWDPPVVGLADIAHFWDAEREGPDEEFTMTSEVLAFTANGRCSSFEEWPFAPPAEMS